MRLTPPPRALRFRWVLLALTLCSWAVGFFVLFTLKGDPSFPWKQVSLGAMLIFVWANGAFWWFEMRLPHVEVAPGKYESRSDLGSGFMRVYSKMFFRGYWTVAVMVTIACIRVAASDA